MTLQRYKETMCNSWDEFVARSRNATFLHYRGYMDYHSDRFQDHSLIFLDNRGKIKALLPANESGNTLYSHQGLTYGGLLIDHKATTSDVIEMFQMLIVYAQKTGFHKIIYKSVPWHYHLYPSEEDMYAMYFCSQPSLHARNIASVIDLKCPLKWSQNRRLGANRAERNGVYVKESDDIDSFWNILTDNLRERYNAAPVHSLKEIKALALRFPSNIRLFLAYDSNHFPQAGTLVYDTGQVAKTQYISSTAEGKEIHAVDLLFRHVISLFSPSHHFFDFGTSNERNGEYLNASLIHQKEGFGGRAVVYDTWEIPLCQ